jgi:hypothetical protein
MNYTKTVLKSKRGVERRYAYVGYSQGGGEMMKEA